MAFVDMNIDGTDAILKRLMNVEKNATSIARSAVSAGIGVLANAAKSASPGTIKQECGGYVRATGKTVSGRAGLMRFPRPGDGQNRPHGVYLDQGTKYIPARGFIGNALRAATGRAAQAMKRAGKRRIQQLASSK